MILYELIANTLGTFPDVEAKNTTGPTATDGTPILKKVVDDLWGFNQALMKAAHLEPSGNDEAADDSQRLRALDRLYSSQTLPPALTNEMIASRRFQDNGWAHTWSPGNLIEVGGSTELIALELGFDGDKKILLVLDAATTEIHKYDLSVNPPTLISSSGAALLAGLDTSGTQDWKPTSFCSDGSFVFVMFVDVDASPETHVVQKYKIADWSTEGLVGWPVGGRTLPGTGLSPDPESPQSLHDRIIIADDDHVATLNSWTNIVAASSAAVSIITRAGGVITASGAGDAPTGANKYGCGAGIVTDDQYIYFCGVDWVTNDGFTASVDISSPTTGLGGGGWPRTSTGDRPMGLAYDGHYIFTATTYISTNTARVWQSTRTDDSAAVWEMNLASYNRLVDFIPVNMAHDGFNLWMHGWNEGFGSEQIFAFSSDCGGASIVGNIPDAAFKHMAWTDPYGIGTHRNRIGGSLYDGRDFWFIQDKRAGQTQSGKIGRVPRSMTKC